MKTFREFLERQEQAPLSIGNRQNAFPYKEPSVNPFQDQIHPNYHVRWMIRRDLDDIAKFDAKASSLLPPALQQRNIIGMVLEKGDRVVGYMVYQLLKDRLYINRIKIMPEAFKDGGATQLLNKLISKLSPHRRTELIYDVKDTDLAAQKWLAAHGFKASVNDDGNTYKFKFTKGRDDDDYPSFPLSRDNDE